MTDHLTPGQRSWNMSRVRSKNTKPELIIRSLLHRQGYRFRIHRKDLPGCPDIVFPKYKFAIFVHGCFWHQHKGCKKAQIPNTNKLFWEKKLSRNIERDKESINELKELGWNVFIIWECEIKQSVEEILDRVNHFIEKVA